MNFFSLLSLPNLLTLLNLLAGCLGIVFVFSYRLEWVPYCVLISLVADYLDGFAARFTKNATDIGKQLDSLADVVSFGVLPGAIMFHLLFQNYESGSGSLPEATIYLLCIPAFLITLFAALRLAKFNTDHRQSDSFLGLPTPAVAIFITGFLLTFLHNSFGLSFYLFQLPVLYGVVIVLSILMVIELPMFALKFKSFSWKGNETAFSFLLLSLVLLATLKFAAISLIVILYLIISLIQKQIKP
ncbi:MAG: CDP-alcohol phosphatidyltransferase family protein [Bacteroidetes bacterium]|nr:CDP-alcohol phosphatidyltransferase family protein [Bacteroidota bacterium]